MRASGLSERDITTAGYNRSRTMTTDLTAGRDHRVSLRIPEFELRSSLESWASDRCRHSRWRDRNFRRSVLCIQHRRGSTVGYGQAVREAKTDADVLARAAGGSSSLIALNSGGVNQPFPRQSWTLGRASPWPGRPGRRRTWSPGSSTLSRWSPAAGNSSRAHLANRAGFGHLNTEAGTERARLLKMSRGSNRNNW